MKEIINKLACERVSELIGNKVRKIEYWSNENKIILYLEEAS